MEIGSRVMVLGGKQGVVRFMGETSFAQGEWVGIELDKPEGKNNGSVNETVYFHCAANYGLFVKKTQVRLVKSTTNSSSSSSSRKSVSSSRLSLDPNTSRRISSIGGSSSSESVQLMKELKQMKEQNQQLQEEKQQINETLVELQAQFQALKQQCDNNQKEEKEEKENPDDLVQLVKDKYEQRIDTMKQEHKQKIDAMKLGMDQQVSDLEKENDRIMGLNDSLMISKEELEKELNKVANLTDKHATENMAKMEETTRLRGKVSTLAREKQELDDQIQELQDMVEMMTLDKETIAMDKEIAEENAEEIQAELDALRAQIALNSNPTSNRSTDSSSDNLEEQNDKLKHALKILHERSATDKMETSKLTRRLSKLTESLEELKESEEQLKAVNKDMKAEILELKEMLDVANAFEEMVEEMTVKNLELSDEKLEMLGTIDGLEKLKEMSEEMEEQHVEYEKELMAEISQTKQQLNQLKNKIGTMTFQLQDKDRTIGQFRELVQQNRAELSKLRDSQQQRSSTTTETNESELDQQHIVDKKLTLRQLNSSNRKLRYEVSVCRLDLVDQQQECMFWRSLLPNQIVTAQDQTALDATLLVSKLINRCSFLLNQYFNPILLEDKLKKKQEDISEVIWDFDIYQSQFLLWQCIEELYYRLKKLNFFLLDCHSTSRQSYKEACLRTNLIYKQADLLLNDLISRLTQTGSIEFTNNSTASRFISWFQEEYQNKQGIDVLAIMLTNEQESQMKNSSSPVDEEKIKAHLNAYVTNTKFFIELKSASLVIKTGLFFSRCASLLKISTLQSSLALLQPLTELCGKTKDLHQRTLSLNSRIQNDFSDFDNSNNIHTTKTEELREIMSQCEADLDNFLIRGQKCFQEQQKRLVQSQNDDEEDAKFRQFLDEIIIPNHEQLSIQVNSLIRSATKGAFLDVISTSDQQGDELKERGTYSNWHVRASEIRAELSKSKELNEELSIQSSINNELSDKLQDLTRSNSKLDVLCKKHEANMLETRQQKNDLDAKLEETKLLLQKERSSFDRVIAQLHKQKNNLEAQNTKMSKQLATKSTSSSPVKQTKDTIYKVKKPALDDESRISKLQDSLRLMTKKCRYYRHLSIQTEMKDLVPLKSATTKCEDDSIRKCNSQLAELQHDLNATYLMPKIVNLASTKQQEFIEKGGGVGFQQFLTQQLKQRQLKQKYRQLQQDLCNLQIDTVFKQNNIADSTDFDNSIVPDVVGKGSFGDHINSYGRNRIANNFIEQDKSPEFIGRIQMKKNVDDTCSNNVQVVLNTYDWQQLNNVLIC